MSGRGRAGSWLEETIMPSHLKDLVRARMQKTGESYEQALRQVRAQDDRAPLDGPSADAVYLKSEERAASVADTAFMTAAVRAEEAARPEAERLFEDPYAAVFTAHGAHAAEATQRFLDLPFVREGVRLRTRYIDDALREALAAGLAQIVLLGAGFDARGLRLPEIAEHDASVYEVDIARQLDRKRVALQSAGVDVPARIAYVPYDFHATRFEESLASSLAAKGFRPGAGAVFVWEGVIGYIDRAVIDRTIRFVVNRGGPRSRLIFTFGEGSFDPGSADESLARAGFGAWTVLDGDALWRRYLPGDPHPAAWVMKIGTATV
jgi:methyltransferase (TIGR00027 family)